MYVDQLNDEQVTILYLYWMFLHNKFTTDTLHSGPSFTMGFLQLMGRNPHIGPPSPNELARRASEFVDKYATKERTQVVFTPCDGSPKDIGCKEGKRKYWVVESNDPEYPLGSKVRGKHIRELWDLDNFYKFSVRVGFGKCPTWCPHCHNNPTTLWHRVVNKFIGRS